MYEQGTNARSYISKQFVPYCVMALLACSQSFVAVKQISDALTERERLNKPRPACVNIVTLGESVNEKNKK